MPPRSRSGGFGKQDAQGRKPEATVTSFISLPPTENAEAMLILLCKVADVLSMRE